MVKSFGLLGRLRAPQHDEIAALAGEMARSSWAVVTLIGADRNWFSGAFNYDVAEGCRWDSFCTHVIANPSGVMWVPDTREDFRFAENPSVLGPPGIRFYAGAPVLVNGLPIGAVAVFDAAPRAFEPDVARSLTRLASIVSEDLAARHEAQARQIALLASADALLECDDRGTILTWSPGAEQLFGFPVDEAMGGNIDIIIPPEQREAHHRGLERWRMSGGARVGRRLELVACRKDGQQIDIELWMSVAHRHGVPHIHGNIRDISQRKNQAAELNRASAEARAANEAKSDFLANMSHELRTPLNGVIAGADLLAKTEQSAYQRELTALIRASSDQLGSLIGDILDLARIESGEMVLTSEPMSLEDILTSVLSLSDLTAQEKGLGLFAELASDITGRVLGDPLRLKQVLTNLVSNAVKFTERGSVSVHVTRDGDQHRFEIRDTGVGFSDSQREVIFGRFSQADGTITRRFGGTGLGLAISRDLLTAMGGDLDGRGKPGEGATFWFTLPLTSAESEADAETAEPAAPDLRRILVVDDNATNRRVAELILHTMGIEVDCVEDGDQAVEAFMAGRYDAILMDMMMPVMDGIAATQAIRALEVRAGSPPTPIIMLTANTLPQHVAACADAGADMHLSKPVSAQGLCDALARVSRPAQGRTPARPSANRLSKSGAP